MKGFDSVDKFYFFLINNIRFLDLMRLNDSERVKTYLTNIETAVNSMTDDELADLSLWIDVHLIHELQYPPKVYYTVDELKQGFKDLNCIIDDCMVNYIDVIERLNVLAYRNKSERLRVYADYVTALPIVIKDAKRKHAQQSA